MALALGTMDEPARRTAAMARHLRACGHCERRFNDLNALFETMPEVAQAGFEEVFTPARLEAQRARIWHRLAQIVGTVEPAHVLAFPCSGRPLRRLDATPGRWLAAVAAAGLLLGVTAGQLIHYHPVAPLNEDVDVTGGETVNVAPRSAADRDRPAELLDMTGTVQLTAPDGDRRTETPPLTLDEFERVMPEEEFLGNLDLALTSFQVSELASIDALTPRVRDFSINIR